MILVMTRRWLPRENAHACSRFFVIASVSEAIQSFFALDCFVALLLAMTVSQSLMCQEQSKYDLKLAESGAAPA
jgi:hypothetical protein